MIIIGVDLAWGDRKPDGVCVLKANSDGAKVVGFAYPHGDDELIRCLQNTWNGSEETFITIDAPIVCPNRKGTRPVDRLTHTLFHKEHAACHPANSTKCKRPPRILRRLQKLGFKPGWRIGRTSKIVAEVYPHPAMVRLFRLPRIVKYKKGSMGERRKEFSKLQRFIMKCLQGEFSFLKLNKEATDLLRTPWSKPVEDKVDALFCAMIGLWHSYYKGTRSEVIGNLKTGFILLPHDLRMIKN